MSVTADHETVQIGIFLVNKNTGSASPLDWRAHKINRVVQSSLAAEALSLYEGLDVANGFKMLLASMLGEEVKELKVFGYVDNKFTQEAIYSTTSNTGKN